MTRSIVKQIGEFESYLDVFLKQNENFKKIYKLRKNLCYSFTYIEYLEKIINEEETWVVKSQLRKSYILTGMSIVEGILFYIIKSNKIDKKQQYEVLNTYTSNEQLIQGQKTKVETRILKKLKVPISLEMNLDSMLKKAQDKKLLGDNSDVYSELNHLRKLRNQIHIHVNDTFDHDFNSFTLKHQQTMRKILYSLVKSEVFNEKAHLTDHLFDFLKN